MTDKQNQPIFALEVSQERFAYDVVKGKVTDLLKKADDFFKSKDVSFLEEEGEYFTLPYLKLKAIEGKNFADLRVKKIAIPPGFKGNYKDYAELLQASADIMGKLKDNLLTPYARWLSANINDPSNLLSGRGGDIRGFDPSDIDSIYKDMSKMFSKGRTDNVGVLGDHFRRGKEIIEVSKLNDDITAKIMVIDRNEVLSKIEEITTYLDILYEKLQEEGQAVSSQTGQMLSKLTLSVAREVEFMGVMMYNFRSFNVAFEQTVSKL